MTGIIWVTPAEQKRGRKPLGDRAMTPAERKRKQRNPEKERRETDIAILDFETDPFDNTRPDDKIYPFAACLYSDQFEPVIIWEENYERFILKVITAIEKLPRSFTIYAHNGGKFDFMFFIHKIRGAIKFKGRAVMCAKIGEHELRDSFHIIPEKLANLQKNTFDYEKMKRGVRKNYRKQICEYMLSDCVYLFDYVKAFLSEFGMKISIGQAAMYQLRQHYKVKCIGANMDAYLRNYFFGGRVECIAGAGHFVSDHKGSYKLYDVNSMYPYVMATRQHPVGNDYKIRLGKPGPHTVFLQVNCRNFGALVKRGENNETTADIRQGSFFTTIWEYETALKYGLIENADVRLCIDCVERSDFSQFVLPLYERRQAVKNAKRQVTEGSTAWNDLHKDDTFLKLILNNAYGKFAQNPRNYKEHCFTDIGERPELKKGEEDTWGALPVFEGKEHAIWERPAPFLRFNNVGTAASITGAARAVLLDAIMQSDDPIYCDTDSLICRRLNGVGIDPSVLGSWKLEAELEEAIICGKKLYAYKVRDPGGQKSQIKVRNKGVRPLEWAEFVALLDGQVIEALNKGVTMDKTGRQFYMRREVRATAARRRTPTIQPRKRAVA